MCEKCFEPKVQLIDEEICEEYKTQGEVSRCEVDEGIFA
jgi:hypothetical protein